MSINHFPGFTAEYSLESSKLIRKAYSSSPYKVAVSTDLVEASMMILLDGFPIDWYGYSWGGDGGIDGGTPKACKDVRSPGCSECKGWCHCPNDNSTYCCVAQCGYR